MKKKGILLVNLGSPESTSVGDVRRYLDEFLMDERVIDKNLLFRNLLVRGIILNTRPKKSAAAYESIWEEKGSPLIVISRQIEEKTIVISDIPVALGMRYGSPSIKSGIEALVNQGVTDISLMPLYPQYAMSTTETVVIKAQKVIKKHFQNIKLHIVPPFYCHPEYIRIISNIIQKYLPKQYDQLIFSYHGVPERHILKYDKTGNCNLDNCCKQKQQSQYKYCYRHQCYETTRLIANNLGLTENQYFQTFQSRLGKDPWIQPFTDDTLASLPAKGIKKIAIVCPAFVSDCLETLEEIKVEGAHIFKENGGVDYHYIPCLNDNDEWIKLIYTLCMEAFDNDYSIPQLKK